MHFFKTLSVLALIVSLHVQANGLSDQARAMCEQNGGEVSIVSQENRSDGMACVTFRCGLVVGEGEDSHPIISEYETICEDDQVKLRDARAQGVQDLRDQRKEALQRQLYNCTEDQSIQDCITQHQANLAASDAGRDLNCRYQGVFRPFTTVECNDGKTYELRDENTATEVLSENILEIMNFLNGSEEDEKPSSLKCSYAGGGNFSLVIDCDDDKEYAAFSGHRSQAGRIEEWNGNSGTMNNEPQSERLSGDDEPSGAITH